jgi:hypothetical protein
MEVFLEATGWHITLHQPGMYSNVFYPQRNVRRAYINLEKMQVLNIKYSLVHCFVNNVHRGVVKSILIPTQHTIAWQLQ